MTIYQALNGQLVAIEPTSFADAGVKERADIQQMLKQQIDVIATDTLVIAEEFGDWEDSRRRIDLLAIDKGANLVVIELKRTEDGGHMELQALRYSAMVSLMTFDEAVTTYDKYLSANGQHGDARTQLLEFLDWEEPETHEFPTDVRLVLAAADFSKEITTTVLWLNEHGLDVKCVRLRPHNDGGRLLIDVQQLIPIPEAQTYQVKLATKKAAERTARTQNRDLTRYDVTVGDQTFTDLAKRHAIYHVVRALCNDGIDPEAIRTAIPWKTSILTPIEGELDSAAFDKALASLLIEQGKKPQTGRFFIDDGELIHSNGKTYAATKMWGDQTTKAMDELLKAFPGHGISYKESI